MRKRLLVLFLVPGLLLAVFSAFAIVPAFLIPWMIAGNNLVIVDTIMAVGAVFSGLAYYECGHWDFTQCKNTPPAQVNGGSLKVKIMPNPNDRRKNPDPKKWEDDPTKRDVKPKSTVSAPNKPSSSVPNNSWATYLDKYGAPSEGQFINSVSTANTYLDVKAYVMNNNSTQYDADGRSKVYNRYISAGVYHVVYQKLVSLSCDPGYTLTNGSCTLTNAAEVMKPSGTPCEIILVNDVWDFDSQNPDCTSIKDSIRDSSAPGKIRVISQDSSGAREGTSVDRNGSGYTICNDKGPGRSMTCANTRGFDSGLGGWPVGDVTTSSGGGLTGGTDPGGDPGGDGDGDGTGDGSGSGDCAGYGCAKESTQVKVLDELKKAFGSASLEQQNAFNFDPAARAQATLDTINQQHQVPDYSGITAGITDKLGLPAGGQCSQAQFSLVLFSRPMHLNFSELCGNVAPIINWFFWVLVVLAGISETLYILTGRGLTGEGFQIVKN